MDFELRLDHRVNNISLNRSVHVCLVVKCGCHCDHTNDISDVGNQKGSSECGVSLQFFLAMLHIALSRLTKILRTKQSFRQ